MSSPIKSLSIVKRNALLEYLNLFSHQTLQQAKSNVNRATYSDFSINGNTIDGHISDGKSYKPSIAFEIGIRNYNCKGRCSCGKVLCIHLCALALMAIRDTQIGPEDATNPPPKGKPMDYAGLSASLQREMLQKELTTTLGRKLDKCTEIDFLIRLASLYDSHQCRYEYKFSDNDAKALGLSVHSSQGKIRWYNNRHTPVLYSDKPESIVEFWQFISTGIAWLEYKQPSFLDSITDQPRIAQCISRWKVEARKKTIGEWKSKLSEISTPKAAGIYHPTKGYYHWIEGQELRLRLDPNEIVVESRIGADGEFTPFPGKALKVLQNTKLTDLGMIPPDQLAIVRLLQTTYSYGSWMPPSSLSYQSNDYALVSEVVRQLAGTPRLVNQSGKQITLCKASAYWEISRAPDQAQEPWIMRLMDATGNPLEVQMVLPGTPVLLLSGNVAHPAPPPMGIQEQAYVTQYIPQEIMEHAPSIVNLASAKCKLPDEIANKVKPVRLHPRLRCSMEKNIYRNNDILCVELEAVAEDGSLTYNYGHGRWRFLPRLSERDSNLNLPDFESPNQVVALLDEFKLHDNNGNWTRTWTQKFPIEFPEWLAKMPSDTEILLGPDLIGFNSPAVRGFNEIILDETGVSNTDWFDVRVALKVEDTTLTKEEIELLLRAKGRYVRLAKHGWKRLVIDDSEEDNKLADSLGISLNSKDTSATKVRFHALHLASPDVAKHLSNTARLRIQQRITELQSVPRPPIPTGLKATLRPYQLDGFHFLVFLSENKFGGILADDMGLGKTVQALTWIAWMQEVAAAKPGKANQHYLVVCPKSVTYNWQREIERFTPELSAVVFSKEADTTETLLDHNIVIVNYAMFRNRSDFFLGCHWTGVILDEGQNIKNPASLTAKTASQLNADHRFILTGTPVENRLMDLWSLFSFAQPGLLGGLTAFKRQYAMKEDASDSALRRLRQRVRHFMLRRTKGQVATDLPERIEEDVFCDLDGQQRVLYDAELKRARQLVLGVKTAKAFNQSRFNILQSLLRLRQICCDPRLIAPEVSDLSSAKLEALFEQLEELREEGNKVLVFSQFTSMLDLIQPELVLRGWEHLILTGATENRQELVDKFQASPDPLVFLISLKAGGSGLNLTAASYVILYDPWWNPAVEAQAIDRTHRIGQTSTVFAYRLIARDTVEEKIRLMQKRKAALAGAIVEEETLLEVLDLDDLRDVLGIDPEE